MDDFQSERAYKGSGSVKSKTMLGAIFFFLFRLTSLDASDVTQKLNNTETM